jgi:hypothetical protein
MMRSLLISKKAWYIGVLSLLCVLSAIAVPSGHQEPRINTQTSGAAPGSIWLNWDESTQLGFVRGYLVGVHVGYRNGCFWYDNLQRPNQTTVDPTQTPFGRCLRHAEDFSDAPEHYSSKITEFYKSYPRDLMLPLDELLRFLSDSEKKRPNEIDSAIHK